MQYQDLFKYLGLGAALKDVLSAKNPDLNKLLEIMSFETKEQEMRMLIDEKQKQSQVAQMQYEELQAQRLQSERNVAFYKQQKITSLLGLQKFNNEQADINIATYLSNADNLKQAGNSEMEASAKQAAVNTGKIRASFGGTAILAETGTSLDLVRAVADETQAAGQSKYMQRFNQAQEFMTAATKQTAAKAYSQFDTDQQVYFTSIMGG